MSASGSDQGEAGARAELGLTFDAEVIGRERERAMVADLLDGREPRRLLLLGEAGIGKSALWAAGVAAAVERGITVLAASPAASERELSFAVLGDLFGNVLAEHGAALAPPRLRALEIALRLRDPGDSALDPAGIALAVTELVGVLAESGPVLFALDDVQWIDGASAAALAFALRRLHDVRVLATLRTPWLGRQPFGWPVPDATTIELPGLSFGATQRLVSNRVRRFAHLELRWIYDEAAGNPLHSVELARAMRPLQGAAPALDPGLQISALVVRRLDALSATESEVLLTAALLRRPTVDRLARAMGRPVAAELAALVSADLVRLVGNRVRFQHPLYAAACALSAGEDERCRVHLRLADAATDDEDAVRHRALAAPGPDEEVAAQLDEVALLARLRGAPEAAAELSELAGRLTAENDEARSTRRVVATARYLSDAGASATAESRLRDALEGATDPDMRLRLWVALSDVVYESKGVVAARAVTAAALREAGDDPARRAEALVTRASRTELPVADRRVMVDEALALLRTLGCPDPALLALTAREHSLCSFYLGDGLPRGPLHEAARIEDAMRPPPPVAWRAKTVLGECAKYVDGFAEAERLLLAASTDAEEEGDVGSIAEIAGHRAELELWLGRWDSASALAEVAVVHAEQSEREGRIAMAHCYAGLIAAHRGEPTAGDHLAEALATSARTGNDWTHALAFGAAGFLALSEGRLDDARHALASANEIAGRELVCEPRQWRFLPDYVEVLIACGEVELAADRVAPLNRWAARSGGWPEGMRLRAAGLIAEARGDREEALVLLEAAVAAYEALPLPFELARARLAVGAVQRRAGRRRDGRLTLERATAGFAELGAPRWLERTEQELGRVAGRQPVADELTPAEREVARLVASGATNREVAARLSISPRTVEAHLGRIYRKLGVRGRSQLAASYQASTRSRWSRSREGSQSSFEYVVPRTRTEPVTP